MRILHIVGAMYPGGVENFIMNLYRRIDRDRFQFDFIVHQRREQDYTSEIGTLGGRVYELPRLTGHPVSNLRQITALVRENGYRVVIRHTANALVAPQLMAARRGGAVAVCHSHSSDDPQRLLHLLGRRMLPMAADVRLACSEQAGQWMYGRTYQARALVMPAQADHGAGPVQVRSVTDGAARERIRQERGTFQVVRNAVDLDRFAYDPEKAQRVRGELGITGRSSPQGQACGQVCGQAHGHVYGHVGNYIEVKNHSYLLRIFREIVNREPDAVCLCVGEGELRPQIEEQVRALGLQENVILTGLRSDVDAVMSAMDVLIFPSVFEGLPLTLVEAQASGLPMLISDVITRDAAVTQNLVEWRSISEDPARWAERAIELAAAGPGQRNCQRESIADAGYDLDQLVRWYEDFFESAGQR